MYNSRWTDPDESGMVVIELQMLTGYVQEESNAALLARLASLGVKKVENKDKSLVFYIDQVGNGRTLIICDVTSQNQAFVDKIRCYDIV